MITFQEIFERAVRLFDDPDIRHAYIYDKVSFEKRMGEYLRNGMHLLSSPSSIVDLLSVQSDGQGGSESIVAEEGDMGERVVEDGVFIGTLFRLSAGFSPVSGSAFTVRYNGKATADFRVDVDANTLLLLAKATGSEGVKIGDTIVVEWYFAGAFTADFSLSLRNGVPVGPTLDRIKLALAKTILCMWDEEEMNRALENRNILSDSDFTFHSPASSVNAKIRHHDQVLRELDSIMSSLNWRILSTPRGGSNFGQ